MDQVTKGTTTQENEEKTKKQKKTSQNQNQTEQQKPESNGEVWKVWENRQILSLGTHSGLEPEQLAKKSYEC